MTKSKVGYIKMGGWLPNPFDNVVDNSYYRCWKCGGLIRADTFYIHICDGYYEPKPVTIPTIFPVPPKKIPVPQKPVEFPPVSPRQPFKCPVCEGLTRVNGKKCRACKGSGVVWG
jgi:hypothetical protein